MQSAYEAAAGTLRRRILTGRYRRGARLPAERELCGDLNVSRITVRRALDLLEEERLIDRRQGSGTYVAPHSAPRIPLMVDYTGSMRRHAPELVRRRLWRRGEVPPADVGRALGLAPDEVALHARRRDRRGPVTVAVDDAYLPAEFSRRLSKADLGRVDFLEVWRRRERFRIGRLVQRVESVAAEPDWSSWLGVVRGAPVLRATETYYTARGKACGLFVSHYAPACIALVSEYRWPAGSPGPQSAAGSPTRSTSTMP